MFFIKLFNFGSELKFEFLMSKKTKDKEKDVLSKSSRIYNFRVLIESGEEDVIREIEISEDQTFEDFHDAIKKAFNFSGKQMASFYISNDEWEKGLEIALVPIDKDEMDDDNEEEVRVMSETRLKHLGYFTLFSGKKGEISKMHKKIRKSSRSKFKKSRISG